MSEKSWFVSFLVLLGLLSSVPRGRAPARQDQTPSDHASPSTYLTTVRYDTGRFPTLLNRSDSVPLISWMKIRRTGGQKILTASFILPREELSPLQENLDARLKGAVQHEYVLPRPTKWWSLHLGPTRVKPRMIQALRKTLNRVREYNKESAIGDDPIRQALRAENFAGRTRRLGESFLVQPEESPRKNGSTRLQTTGSYALFHTNSGGVTVLGDLVVSASQIGPLIELLYRQDMHFLSLAYNERSHARPTYFVHFAGSGQPAVLVPSVVRLLEFTSASKRNTGELPASERR